MTHAGARGKTGESAACFYLREKGYRILERNYTTRYGELDIIAEKEGILLFVEVKTRDTSNRIGFADALPAAKLQRMQKAIELYFQKKEEKEWFPLLLCVELDEGIAKVREIEL